MFSSDKNCMETEISFCREGKIKKRTHDQGQLIVRKKL